MATILVECVLPHMSGLVRDNVVTNWAFLTPSVGYVSAEANTAATAVRDFFNTIPAGHNAPAGFIGPQISRAALAARLKVYDLTGHLDGSAHGSPKDELQFTLANMVGGAQGLPSEVAACVSFQSAYGADPEFAPPPLGPGGGHLRPRARDRGRVYIGPLTQSTLDAEAGTNRVKFTQTFRESLAINAAALRDAAGHAWAVWSRVNAILNPVTVAWVDDAIDIQRRRGERPNLRTIV